MAGNASQPSPGPHPLLDETLRTLSKNSEGKYILTPERLAQLEKAASSITSGRELYELAQGLFGLAVLLEDRYRSPDAARALVEVVEGLAPRLEKLAKEEGEALQRKAQQVRKQVSEQKARLEATRGPLAGLAPGSTAGVGLRKPK